MTYEEVVLRAEYLYTEFQKIVKGETWSAALMALRCIVTDVAADMPDEDRKTLARIFEKSILSAPELIDAVVKETTRHAH